MVVDEKGAGQRLDVFLAKELSHLPSRSFIQKLIDAKAVWVNGVNVKRNTQLEVGHIIEIDEAACVLPDETLPAEKMALDIFYEDDDLVIIHKPHGLTVHPASGDQTGTLVNGLLFHFGQDLSDRNGEDRPGIVHRLDKDTSGLILIAKNNVAHARLGRQFEKHEIYKKYIARVVGQVQFDQGMIDVPLMKHKKYHDMRQVAPEGEGKEATTLYQVMKRFPKSTLLSVYPQTGRTHQIRVHLKHLGHPIMGDEKYGQKDTFPRLALHAMGIGFTHPTTKDYMEFSLPMPAIFADPTFG